MTTELTKTELKTKCPNCKTIVDMALPLDNETDVAKEGSVCICGECGNINILDSQMNLRDINEKEMLKLKETNPNELAEILDLSFQIMAKSKKSNN